MFEAKPSNSTDVLIVGAGLAGLYLADRLQQAGRDYVVLEARHRLGGRILSLRSQSVGEAGLRYDLGPAWFWPGQANMERLVEELNVDVFEQFADGYLVFEDRNGMVQRDLQYSTMAGSLRITGGMQSLIDVLTQRIPAHKILRQAKVTKLEHARAEIAASVVLDDHEATFRCSTAVLALPPRLAATSIVFAPQLAADALAAMRAIPTWMAGHAKVVAVYERAFWRAAGLSGDGISHRGPLVEIHDASPKSSAQGALFGFVGVPAQIRQADGFDVVAPALEQLIKLYGPNAANPVDVLAQDWAEEAFTATEQDARDESPGHQSNGSPLALMSLWGGQLMLGSSEMGRGFGGYLEGALEAADTVLAKL
ncbi:MAG: monoamine oxidase [Gammaproteobacteria bacterium]|jgi:monoamine oxidase